MPHKSRAQQKRHQKPSPKAKAKGHAKPRAEAARAKPNAKPVPAKAPAVEHGSVLDAIRPKLPELSAEMRAAFESLYSDAQCEDWGARTKSAGVKDDGSRFALEIARTLLGDADKVPGYSPRRLAWLVDRIDALDAAIAAQRGGQAVAELALSHRAVAEQTAAAKRAALEHKLNAIAGGAETRRATVSAATADSERDPASTLDNLAAVAERWLGARTPLLPVLVHEAGLCAADVADARLTADALRVARGEKTLGGVATRRDTPEVNRVEGRVLREMKWAMECFARAHAADSRIGKLVPSAATRNVLAGHARAGDGQTAPAASTK